MVTKCFSDKFSTTSYLFGFIIVFALNIWAPVTLPGQEALNVSLFAQFDRGDERYSGSWVYTDFWGTEYALLGAKTGTAIYKIIGENQVEEVAFIPGPATNWREITVVGDYAYVVTDVSGSDHGMQVIRLYQLPQLAPLVTTYDETFTTGHIIQKDIFNENPYVYICGTSTTEGVHIMDVSQPENPVEVGLYNPGYYIHDCHVNGNRMYASAFYEGTMDIVDISDKSNPTLISRFDVPDGFVHSSSLTSDGKHLFVAPEKDQLPARIFNIEDPFDVEEIARYTANPLSLVHNPYILGDFAFISHNTEGLRVVDLKDPATPVEVGFYDTWSGASGGFNGLWSACPYLPSGKIIGGNREDGLYIWEFEQTYAGRLYGTVIDSITNLPIPNANIVIQELSDTTYSSALGTFGTGAIPGTFQIKFSANNYFSKTVEIAFEEESEENIVVKLRPGNTATQSPITLPGVHISPNPFTASIQLKTPSTIHGGKLFVYNGLGEIMLVQSIKQSDFLLPANDWPPGMYIVLLTNQQGRVVHIERLIKM